MVLYGILPRLTRSAQFCNFRISRMYATVPKAAPFLVSPQELKQSMSGSKLVVLDASWYMPNSPRKPAQEFLDKRLPDSRFLDLDEVASTHELGLKHMMPSTADFARACGEF